MGYSQLEDYFMEKENYDYSSNRNRTINVKEPLHQYYKKVSSHFDILTCRH